jgi:hypothetical protein
MRSQLFTVRRWLERADGRVGHLSVRHVRLRSQTTPEAQKYASLDLIFDRKSN